MQKFQTMKEAAGAAGKICSDWLVRETGERADEGSVHLMAEALDAEVEASGQRPAAFLCSKEGAIGLTPDYEYNAQWLLFPLPDEGNMEADLIADLTKQLEDLECVSTEELKKIWKP